jgi:hypothetical protein
MHQVTIKTKSGMNASFNVNNPNDTIEIIEKAKKLAESLEHYIPGPWGLNINGCRIEF